MVYQARLQKSTKARKKLDVKLNFKNASALIVTCPITTTRSVTCKNFTRDTSHDYYFSRSTVYDMIPLPDTETLQPKKVAEACIFLLRLRPATNKILRPCVPHMQMYTSSGDKYNIQIRFHIQHSAVNPLSS